MFSVLETTVTVCIDIYILRILILKYDTMSMSRVLMKIIFMNYRNKIPRSNGGFYLFAINYFLGFLMFACGSVWHRGSPTF